MFIKPKWSRFLPKYIIPDKEKIVKLENFREEFNIPHDLFSNRIASSQYATRKTQKYFLQEYRKQFPDASKQELYSFVLISRIDSHKNSLLNQVERGIITQIEAEERFGRLVEITEKNDEIIESGQIKTFDDLCNYIIFIDEKIVGETYSNDDAFLGKKIDEILEENS